MSPGVDYGLLDDRKLLSMLRKRDIRAFDVIWKKYHSALYAYSMKLLKNADDASDIVQDLFVKVWEHSEMIPEVISLKGYLYSMTKNKVLNFIRDHKAHVEHNYRIAARQGTSVENEAAEKLERKHLLKRLDEAIGSLPPQQRRVAMSRREGMSNSEIADQLDLSLNTVNVHWRLGLTSLKDKMKDLLILFLFLNIW